MSFELIATKSRDLYRDLYPDDTEDMVAADASRYRERHRETKEKGLNVVRNHLSNDAAYLGKEISLKKVELFVATMRDAQIHNVENQGMKDHANIFWKNMFPEAGSLRENTW